MDRFIKNKEINLENLQIVAKPLPKPVSFKKFAEQFGTDKKTVIHSPISDVVIDVKSQYYKMKTWKENRLKISGAIKETIEDPLLIISHKGAIKYYAPFIDKNNLAHVLSITENENGVDILKSNFEPFRLNTLAKLLSVNGKDILYIKDIDLTKERSEANSIKAEDPSSPIINIGGSHTSENIIPKISSDVKSKNNLDEAQEVGLHKDYNEDFVKTFNKKTISTIKEKIMAFVKLTNEENPKLGVSVDSALNYKDKDGKVQQRQKATALLDVIEEAGKVAAMNKGTVTFNASINGKYENYFVNKDDKGTIVLRNPKDPYNKDATVYVNQAQKKEGEGHFYSINTSTKAGKDLVEGVNLKTVERDSGNSQYLKVSVRLKNEDLKAQLVTKGIAHTAILSKDGIRIVKDTELSSKSQEPKEKAKEAKTADKAKSKDIER